MRFLNIIKRLIKQVYLDFLYFFINNFVIFAKLRAKLYKYLHPDIKLFNNVGIRKSVTLYNGSNLTGKLSIGNNSFINDECFLDFSSELNIGDNVAIGMRVLIISSTHKIGNPIRCGKIKNKTTTIKNNCWIGAGSIIYPGVTIGESSIIAAGEIVSIDIPANKLFKNGHLSDIIVNKK